MIGQYLDIGERQKERERERREGGILVMQRNKHLQWILSNFLKIQVESHSVPYASRHIIYTHKHRLYFRQIDRQVIGTP